MSDDSKFCEACGTSQEPGGHFCDECGHPVDAPASGRPAIPVPLQWVALFGGVAAIGVVAVVVALIVSGVFDSDDTATSQGRSDTLLFATPTEPLVARPAGTESPSAPVGFETAEDAIGDFYGVSGAMPYCDDASLAPGVLCASIEGADELTLTFLIGETFSEFFDTVIVRQLEDESWVVDEVQEFIFSAGFDTAEEAVYAAFGYGPETPIINCNSGQSGASKPCWDTPTYLSVSESGDLVYLFRPQFLEWYWVLVKEGSDGSFDVADIVPAEGEFELFNSPFVAAKEFYTPEDAIYDHFGFLQGHLLNCSAPGVEPSDICFEIPAVGSVTEEGNLVYLFRSFLSEWHWVLVRELPGGLFEVMESVPAAEPREGVPPF